MDPRVQSQVHYCPLCLSDCLCNREASREGRQGRIQGLSSRWWIHRARIHLRSRCRHVQASVEAVRRRLNRLAVCIQSRDRGLPAAAACSWLPAGEGLWKGLVDILWSAFVQIADETGLLLRLLQG